MDLQLQLYVIKIFSLCFQLKIIFILFMYPKKINRTLHVGKHL